MLPLFKRIILLSISLYLAGTVTAQNIDTYAYSETDSLQDIQIEHLDKQIEVVKSLLRKNMDSQALRIDSLKSANEEQADQLVKLLKESELLTKKLASAFEEIEQSQGNLKESNRVFKTIYFITVPVLLLVAMTVFAILLVLLTRHKNSTNAKINALRKYTLDGIEEVRADYMSEIKRRVKKIAATLKGSGKKKRKAKSSSSKAAKAKKAKSKKSEKK